MFTKSLLINYAGFPNEPRLLVPDNGLANLAAALIQKGHSTTILDYATVDMIEKLFPYEYKEQLDDITKRIMVNQKQGLSPNQKDLDEFHGLDEKIENLQRKKVQEIATEISSIVRKKNIDFVGFKLWMGDGFEGSIMIAEQLKKDYPRLPIFAGGPHVDWFREKIFDVCDAFDAIAYGDGEEVITMLADYVSDKIKLEDIPNLIYRKNNGFVTTQKKLVEDLNNLPLPVYDDDVYPAMKNNQKIKMIIMDESRGCPNNCNFCLHPMKSGNRWKIKSAESIVDEMERLVNKYDINIFKFAGSNTPQVLFIDVAKEILKRKLKIRYVAFGNTKSDTSVKEFKLMKDSGCYGLWFGIESGSQKILDEVLNKKIKVEQLKNKLINCKEAGIYTSGSIIIPAPNETVQTKQETLQLLLETKPDSIIVSPPVVIPGTIWDKNSEKFGISISERNKYLKELMLYKIKFIYPTILWNLLPYFKINEKSDKQITGESNSFAQILEKNGILTQISVDTILISEYSGLNPVQFRDKCRKLFSTGNYEEITKIITKINENIANSISKPI
ncbi:MAG: hypothetical protein A2474_05865 [Elusimicrobia bacterium RIFOXYC2_FULL_34_12]|nr:MAG: hypothetical protein A2474_05865 [Elusimicrobia bacterium RIFOXYC2_FULL_34_12]OGS39659.1 MAG: hypothetical protein A2551_07945 [Elusimicrobia bacterium RIFOXYD2_FULL_34_30]HAM38994.1 hypothetical protein [Elusimicrobiota bacterium]